MSNPYYDGTGNQRLNVSQSYSNSPVKQPPTFGSPAPNSSLSVPSSQQTGHTFPHKYNSTPAGYQANSWQTPASVQNLPAGNNEYGVNGHPPPPIVQGPTQISSTPTSSYSPYKVTAPPTSYSPMNYHPGSGPPLGPPMNPPNMGQHTLHQPPVAMPPSSNQTNVRSVGPPINPPPGIIPPPAAMGFPPNPSMLPSQPQSMRPPPLLHANPPGPMPPPPYSHANFPTGHSPHYPSGNSSLPHSSMPGNPVQFQPPPRPNNLDPRPMMNSGSNALRPPGPTAQFNSMPGMTHGMGTLTIRDQYRAVNLMQERRIISDKKHQQKPLQFEDNSHGQGLVPPGRKNCSPEVFRCTLNAIPGTQALLNKVKLPLGLIIHPFKDLSSLPVISAGTIVRCKRCRTYINPFVDFLDERRWRCNLCFVVNDVPDEFLHHPVTKSYGEPHTRPECTNATLEFIAPQEYMVRPPQPAVYMFLFDVSHAAIETGYLQVVCDALLDHIDHLPGDGRTKIGFLTYNGTLHYYRLAEGLSQPQMLIVSDLEEAFLPTPDSLLVNLRERKELVCDLLRQLRDLHENNTLGGEVETQSALGAALQAAEKLMAPFGGRVTVFQQEMPTTGPGALKAREQRTTGSGDVATELLNPSTDFYKKLALDSSAHQVAIDFFFMNSQFIDVASLSCSSRFSAGDLHYYPGLHTVHNPIQVERLSRDLDRYFTRKIGFEAVMRIRCTKGLAIHTFHGNFFVRSTDLLALANINPDAGFGLNLSIEEALSDLPSVCIQAALLYTSSKGERRIRVHTMCFPVAKNIGEIFNAVDSHAVVSLLSKMAVDRSVTASISDAKDALVNAVIDVLKSYKEIVNPGSVDGSLLVPPCMKTFPLLISCLLKHPAFSPSAQTRLDDRVFAMIDLKMQPAVFALQSIHPDLYRVDDLTDEGALDVDERVIPQPALLPLSAESINRDGVYLLDTGWRMFLHVGLHANRDFLRNVIGVNQFSDIEQPMYSLPDLENEKSESFHNFVEWLQDQRPQYAPLQVIRSDTREHYLFMMYMRKDKTESSMSFQEFLLHIQQNLSK